MAADGGKEETVSEYPPLLTSASARQACAAIDAGAAVANISVDLGRSCVAVPIANRKAWFGPAAASEPGLQALERATLQKVTRQPNKCFEVIGGKVHPLSVFSEATGWVRSLMPTADAPTTLVAGFPMHRVRGTTPLADTRAKVRALGRPRGRALDTATGLGYSAIELAKTCAQVVTVELDPAAIDLARRNPWSEMLFTHANIRLIIGDVGEQVTRFADASFDVVLHDPPTAQLAGSLYSQAFYAQLRRVLAAKGRLFHYVGDPASVAGGRLTAGVMRRLQDAGFRPVRRASQAFGVVAFVKR